MHDLALVEFSSFLFLQQRAKIKLPKVGLHKAIEILREYADVDSVDNSSKFLAVVKLVKIDQFSRFMLRRLTIKVLLFFCRVGKLK